MVHQSGTGFEWGWLAPRLEQGVGQYYVKLPQSEQRVVYTADSSGYHGAVAVNTSDDHHTHTATFALGQKAIELNAQQNKFPPNQQNTATTQEDPKANGPIDIYLLHQQFSPQVSNQPQFVLTATNEQQLSNYHNNLTPLYNIQTQHPATSNGHESSKPLTKEAKTEQTYITPVVQVFKDHSCTDDHNKKDSEEIQNDLKQSQDLFAEVSRYTWKNINGNFGAKTKQPLFRGEANYRVENPRLNDRSERVYYTAEHVYDPEYNATQEGIKRLVASTQDLISNEDLLKINNAIEQHLRDHGDELIKPRDRHSARSENESLETSPTMITVQAKISNILKEQIEHAIKDTASEEVLKADLNAYKFSTPIVVAEGPNKNLGSQMLDNVVTTVLPYLENGYEIVEINSNKNQYDKDDSEENMVNVTPRPVSSNYLAPLTVALRLLNSNDNETYYQDDHEGADSELVADAVAKPNHRKTIVQIQESIPLDVTHINEVEVHEYLDEGRSNNQQSYGIAKSLYDKLSSSLQLKDNLNKILNKYNYMNSDENTNNNQNSNQYEEAKEQLETSENIQNQVQINPHGNNQRSELSSYYSNSNEYHYKGDSQKIIQPIIIEKQVPITKFVNRYIEKQVPYPEAVAVPIPVDRPVPYAVEKLVEKPVQVTKYVDKPYPVEVPRPYPVEVQVPYPVQEKVYIDRPVHVAYPVEKIVEKPVVHEVRVPAPYGVPIEVPYPVEHKILYPFPVDRPVPVTVEVEKPVETVIHKEVPIPYPVEKIVPYPVPYETKVPVPYPVEKKIHVPVEKIVEKPVPQIVEKPVHIRVPVPHPVPVHVHHPYPVEKIVEKKIPYPVPVDRIVERKVPVKVPFPVEKIVEKPVIVTKYIHKPYPIEKLVHFNHVQVKQNQHEDPNDVRVAYRYKLMQEESRNHPQYQTIDQNEIKKRDFQNMKTLYEQYVSDLQKEKKNHQLKYEQNVKDSQKANAKPIALESTHWGNHYASSFQYINTSDQNPKVRSHNAQRDQEVQNYINYLRDQNAQRQYYGYSQAQNQYRQNQNDHNVDPRHNQNYWDKNKNYLVEVNVRRTDRVPKVTIEYGGFKPPLIPSTEVDLDGMPINKSES